MAGVGTGGGSHMPLLVRQSPELAQGLLAIEEASRNFASPDPTLRARGESVFLQLRQDTHAIEHAIYALQTTQDAFVQFQALNIILENLSTLSLHDTSPGLASLADLRDFLLAYALARAENAAISNASPGPSSTTWPQYVRVKTSQAFAAVQVRLLALELQHAKDQHQAIAPVLDSFAAFVRSRIVEPASSAIPAGHDVASATHYARFGVCMAMLSALLEDAARGDGQQSRDGVSSRKHEKSRASDPTGLSQLQRRWARAAVQTFVLESALSAAVRQLSEAATGAQDASCLSTITPLTAVLEHALRWTFIADSFAGLDTDLTLEQLSTLLLQDPVQEEDEISDRDEAQGTGARVRLARHDIPAFATTFLSPDLVRLLSHLHSLAMKLNAGLDRDASICCIRLRRCLLLAARFKPAHHSNGSHHDAPDAMRAHALLDACDTMRTEIDTRSFGPLQTDVCRGSLLVLQLYDEIITTFGNSEPSSSGLDAGRIVPALTQETQRAIAMAFGSHEQGDEDEEVSSLAEEAVMIALSAWHSLSSTHADARATVSHSVVLPYIQQRLIYAAASVEQEDETSELGEETAPDHEVYSEQLMLLAALARFGNLPEVLHMLKEQLDAIAHRFATFYQTDGPISVSPLELQQLEMEWEKLHWLALIAGHVLSDNNFGETGCIPREIESLDAAQQQLVGEMITAFSVRLIGMLLGASPGRPQSPQVFQTLLWITARWIPSYLLTPSPPAIRAIFGGEHGNILLACIVRQLYLAVRAWLADADIVLQIAAVLHSLSLSDYTKAGLLSLPEFEELVGVVLEGLGSLPSKTHKPVVSALIGCIYATSAGPQAEAMFNRVTQSIEGRLSHIVHQKSFASSQVFQRADVVEGVQNALDLFDGLAASVQPRSRRAVYTFLSRFFGTFVNLAKMYADRSEVVTAIVRIMRDLVRSMDLGFGVDDDIVAGLVEGVWELLHVLDEKALLGDCSAAALEEEIPFEGLCLTLDMLLDLKSASEDDNSQADAMSSPMSHQKASDVCMYGLSRLLPFYDGNVADVARVRSSFADLLSRMLMSFAPRLTNLLIRSTLDHDETGVGIFVNCCGALSLFIKSDEAIAVLDALGAANALGRAIEQGFAAQRHAHRGDVASLHTAQKLAVTALLSLSDTTLRAVLIEPLAPSMLSDYIATLHVLIHAISSTCVGLVKGDTGAEQTILQQHFAHFCATTSLSGVRAAAVANAQHVQRAGAHDESSKETQRRRAALADAVMKVIGTLLSQAPPENGLRQGLGSSQNHLDAARDVAWRGRTDIQIR